MIDYTSSTTFDDATFQIILTNLLCLFGFGFLRPAVIVDEELDEQQEVPNYHKLTVPPLGRHGTEVEAFSSFFAVV